MKKGVSAVTKIPVKAVPGLKGVTAEGGASGEGVQKLGRTAERVVHSLTYLTVQ